MKFREGNYALYCEGDNTELCRIVKVCSTGTYKVVFNDGNIWLTKDVRPVPINECDIERLGFSLYSKSSSYWRYRTTSETDDEGDVLTKYSTSKTYWVYENLPSSTCVSVRYIHEVQNLMEVLNDL